VTERTEELNKQKIELETIFETSKDAIAIIDLESNFLHSNKAYIELAGYTKEELLKTSFLAFSVPEDLERSKQAIDKSIQYGFVENHEQSCYNKDGDIFTINTSMAMLPDKKRMLITAKNITDEVILRKELILSKDAAEEANKFKSEFLANMSHEIRTPMNAIIGMTNLALESELNNTQHNYVNKANIAAESLLGIINDILDFSKIEAGKLELSKDHFRLREVISHTLHLMSVSIKDRGIKTKVKLDKEVPPIYFSDSLRLGQVLINLVSNAVKFSHNNGTITLSISLLEENDKDATIRFCVTDEGIGISETNQKKLFQSFSQADSSTQRKFGGTGLGLVISQKIIHLMGGEIWVESEEGKGSTFIFTITMKKSNTDSLIESNQNSEKAMQLAIEKIRGSHILLVEDNEMNQELAEDLLSRNGTKVTIANNGEEALNILKEQNFDVILMDCQMPVMDGYEATRYIRKLERYKTLAILAMTANVMSTDKEKALESGMDDLISKPINPVNMFTTMARWIKRDSLVKV
jgi:PAS domain S-box-containing protein